MGGTPDSSSIADLHHGGLRYVILFPEQMAGPELAGQALKACYIDTAAMPFGAIWIGVQALERAMQPQQAASFVLTLGGIVIHAEWTSRGTARVSLGASNSAYK